MTGFALVGSVTIHRAEVKEDGLGRPEPSRLFGL
jgi:hypothetical protein